MKKLILFILGICLVSLLKAQEVNHRNFDNTSKISVGINKSIDLSKYLYLLSMSDSNVIISDKHELKSIKKIKWKSSNAKIARIDRHGLLEGISVGKVTITVVIWFEGQPPITYEGVVDIGNNISSIKIPMNLTIPHYCSKEIKLDIEDRNGQTVDYREITWTSDNPNIAFIRPVSPIIMPNTIGEIFGNKVVGAKEIKIIAKKPGRTNINFKCEGVTATCLVTVTESDITRLISFPPDIEIDLQEQSDIYVTGFNSEGCNVPIDELEWHFLDNGIATIISSSGNSCRIKGVNVGNTKLIGTSSNGITAEINILVPSVDNILLTPSGSIEIDIQEQKLIQAELKSASGKSLNHRSVTWQITNNNVNFEPSSGYSTEVTGLAVGSTILSVSSEGITNGLRVRVPPVESIVLEPSSANISVNSFKNFNALFYAESGKQLQNRPVVWEVSDELRLVSNSNNSAIVQGINSGNGSLKITCEDVSKSASVNVRRYCEDNLCATYYFIANWSSNPVDIYEIKYINNAWSNWRKVTTLNSDFGYTSSKLQENVIYIIRVVEEGASVNSINDIELETYPFVGGEPGSVAEFYIR